MNQEAKKVHKLLPFQNVNAIQKLQDKLKSIKKKLDDFDASPEGQAYSKHMEFTPENFKRKINYYKNLISSIKDSIKEKKSKKAVEAKKKN